MAAILLAGCGGGGGDAPVGTTPTAPVVTTVTITGTAAAGLPLIGNVTVKDAKGATKAVTLGADGSYSVDVTGMTPPLLMRAEGTVGSTRYVIHSASATADASGTVNITPLTDLIVANAAGQLADAYFNSGNFSSLTRTELDAESAALKARLLPVLTAMKVDAAIDLMRTPFTPLSSALDKALDVIRVSVDPATHLATLTNLVTQVAITDDLARKAASEGTASVLPGTGLATAADDLPAIRKAVTDILDLFKTSLPSPATVQALLSSDFLHQGQTAAAFATALASQSDLIGASFRSIEVTGIDYANNGGASPLATLRLVFVDKNGGNESLDGWQVIKTAGGAWRWRGNQDVFDFSGGVSAVKNAGSGCVATGFEFNVHENNTGLTGAVARLRVTGSGLPAEGLQYRRSISGNAWEFYSGGNVNPYWYRLSSNCGGIGIGATDASIAALPDAAVYTLTGFNAAGTPVALGAKGTQALRTVKRPLTLAEAIAATFPSIATSSPLASYAGGPITISGIGANPGTGAWVYLGLTLTGGAVDSVDGDTAVAANGSFSKALTLATPAPGSVIGREVRVMSRDAYGRAMLTHITY